MKFLSALLCSAILAACSGGGGLAPGLTERMDQPGANLDRAVALNMVNQFRASEATAPLAADSSLDSEAQRLAAEYAASGTVPARPDSIASMRVSAGYSSFAETFSGWRNSAADAEALLAEGHSAAGLGVAYSANSAYGVHWVMLFR